MISQVYFPQFPLANFVELFWSYEGFAPSYASERVLPTGTVSLIFHLDSASVKVFGPHSTFFTLDTSRPASLIGVHFRPGGAFQVLGLPTSEVHNVVVSLDDLWGKAVHDLHERLLEVQGMTNKFRVLEGFLLTRTTKLLTKETLSPHAAVAHALRAFDLHLPPSVTTVTEELGLSSRRFSQVFAREVGLTPKLYARVRRFQKVLGLLGDPRIDWADVALACGYFDQAHFIHDFHTFAGLNPTTYISSRTERFNHVPLE